MRKSLITNTLIFIALCFFSSPTFGQYYKSRQYGATLNSTVYSSKYKEGKIRLDDFIKNTEYQTLSVRSNLYSTRLVFHTSISYSDKIDSFVQSLGYVTESSINTQNIAALKESQKEVIEAQQDAIKGFEESINIYEEDTSLDATTLANRINNLKSRVRSAEQRIKSAEKELSVLKQTETLILVTLDLNDEISTPNGSNQKITWVNMPGASYSYLSIENPKLGLTHDAYAGYNLKYLFTRGKSYMELGVLKPITPYTEQDLNDSLLSSTKNDFFIVQFGQDFYTRHFGRGRRKFFNLYSGYSLGLLIPNQYNDAPQQTSGVASLNIGVEVFKSKHVLLDTRAAYFLPINNQNRNTRGIILNTSFNFVF